MATSGKALLIPRWRDTRQSVSNWAAPDEEGGAGGAGRPVASAEDLSSPNESDVRGHHVGDAPAPSELRTRACWSTRKGVRMTAGHGSPSPAGVMRLNRRDDNPSEVTPWRPPQ